MDGSDVTPKRVLILPESENPFSFGILLKPGLTPVEEIIRSRLAERLSSRSVEIWNAGQKPREDDVVVVMVEKKEDESPLGAMSPVIERAKAIAGRSSEARHLRNRMNRDMQRAERYDRAMRAAREKNARVIWVLVEGAAKHPSYGTSSWAEALDGTVELSSRSVDQDLDTLARVVEHPLSLNVPSLGVPPPGAAAGGHVEARSQFDVFLCHNSADKPSVREIAKRLAQRRIRYWLDEEQIRPGTDWQEALEEQIENIQSAAVFVGLSGLGPWHNREIRAFIIELVERKCPVVPVILSNAVNTPKLPTFLKTLTWVDFRRTEPDPLDQLIWGITGKRATPR